jgi:3-methyladenine DNA glycosylase AlkD
LLESIDHFRGSHSTLKLAMARVSSPSGSVAAEVQAILKDLQSVATEKKRASALRVGIPMGKAYGVSVGHVRSLARRWKGRVDLAVPLWATAIHEARLLAVLLADPESMSRSDLELWLSDVVSWDLCDHLCGDLVSRRSDAADLVRRWIRKPDLYFKRAAFAVMAQVAVHDKTLDVASMQIMLGHIIEYADDDRPHVRQAASWALRSIGKRDAVCRERALSAAVALLETEDVTKRWVGRDAMRELEKLIKVPERRRLLSSKASTARKQGGVDPAAGE